MRQVLLLLFGTSLAMATPKTLAATIKKINAAKKTVTIDEGSDAGFQKKSKVCFYDGSTKLGCGSVRTVKARSATVRVKSPKTFAKLKEGQEARLELAGAMAAMENAHVEYDPNASPNYFRISTAFPAMPAVSHANLIYETPQDQLVESMWSSDKKSRVTGSPLGLEAGIGIGSTTLALGVKFKAKNFFRSKRIASDYDDRDGDTEGYFEEYAETSSEASSFGGFIDFYYLNYSWGIIGLKIGNGIEYDNTKVTFTMEQKNENNPDIDNVYYQGISNLTSKFLRTNLLLDVTFGSFGIDLGTTIAVPLSQSQIFKLDIDADPFAKNLQNLTPEEDLKKSLDHKASLALEVIFGAHINY